MNLDLITRAFKFSRNPDIDDVMDKELQAIATACVLEEIYESMQEIVDDEGNPIYSIKGLNFDQVEEFLENEEFTWKGNLGQYWLKNIEKNLTKTYKKVYKRLDMK